MCQILPFMKREAIAHQSKALTASSCHRAAITDVTPISTSGEAFERTWRTTRDNLCAVK